MLEVELRNNRPYKVRGYLVSDVIDSYRIWPRWWEGYQPREYFKLEVEGVMMDIYYSDDGWYASRK
jgi:hypothetical protein